MSELRDDFTVRQGTTWADSLQLLDADDEPVPLTGCDVRMQVRARPTALEPILDLALGAGLELDVASGLISRRISDEQTAALPVGTWAYDLFVQWPDSTVTCLVSGELTVVARLTQL